MAEAEDDQPPPPCGVWEEIRNKVCSDAASPKADKIRRPSPDRFKNVYHTDQTAQIMQQHGHPAPRRWVIGSYTELSNLASHMRLDHNRPAEAKLLPHFDMSCYGRRHNDTAPDSAYVDPGAFAPDEKEAKRRQRRGLPPTRPEHVLNAADPAVLAQRADKTNTQQRQTDRFKPREDYYEAKSLEAHHIVEKSLLGRLGLNKEGLDDQAAPCVLLACEIHQQLFTQRVRDYRKRFTRGMSNATAADELKAIYKELYGPPEFAALKKIAMIIIRRVRHSRTD